MKIAVCGKGGSGKTTITAILTRLLARRGVSVLAIDGDPNPNLAYALGIAPNKEVESVPRNIVERRQDETGAMHHVLTTPLEQIIDRYAVTAPDGVKVLVGTRVDHAGAG